MEFIWDSEKAKSNLKKHKISFEEAVTVFYDPLARITDDPDHSIEEERLIIIGYSQKSNLLFVVHVYKESEQIIRVISARKASLQERSDFENIVHGGY
jgi:uncharacterized DUF497 family protein